MAVLGFFQKDVPVGKIRDEELRKTRMDLQMARNQSRQAMQDVEREKQALFEKAVKESSKDLRRSYLSQITTLGFKMQLERRMLEGVEGQMRIVSVVEAVKQFQRRQINSPLLDKLVKLRLTDLDSAMQDLVKQGFYGDQVASEIVQRWTTGFELEGSEDVQELEREIEQAQASMASGTDPATVARQLNEQHTEKLEKRPIPGAS